MSAAMSTNQAQRRIWPVPSHVPSDHVFDFDLYHDDRLQGDVQRGILSLRDAAPDIFFTPRNGGYWVATRFSDIRQIMTDSTTFASSKAYARPIPPEKQIPFVPIHMDAPDHMQHRLLLLKFLGAKEVKKLEPAIRAQINELIDSLDGRNSCSFRPDFACPMPVKVFLGMMQWDTGSYAEMASWVDQMVDTDDIDAAQWAYARMDEYLVKAVDFRVANPGDDPVSILLASEIDGVRVTPKRVLEFCSLLFQAGLDTVANAIVFFMYHMATHPDFQAELRADPGLIPQAVEELLRRYSFVNLPRRVTRDIEIDGVTMKEGDIVVCCLAGASNDEDKTPNPETVDLGRRGAPNLAFNTGPHACAGAPLARLELRIFLEEWLRRMPEVRLAPGFTPNTRLGTVMCLRSLDIEW